MKVATNSRPFVDFHRRADLLDIAGVHQDQTVRHGERLDLIVGHIDRRGAEPALQRLDLEPHLHPELGVEVRQRLVEQKDARIAHNGPAHGDALALTAREILGRAVEIIAEPQQLGRLGHGGGGLLLGDIAQAQAEAHVLGHAQMRVERVILEHHGDVAVLRLDIVDHPPVDRDRARGHILEPGDHPEHRRLAAARATDQRDEFAVVHGEIHPMDHLGATIALGEPRNFEFGQCLGPLRFWAARGAYLPDPAIRPETRKRLRKMTSRIGGTMAMMPAAFISP